MRSIFIIIKKELKRFFTDRRMLLSLFLPGIILYLVYSLMGNVMGGAFSADEAHVYRIAVNVESETYTDAVFDYMTQNSQLAFEKVVIKDTEESKAKMENGEIDLTVIYEKGGNNALDSYEVLYNSTSPESTAIYSEFIPLLSSMSATPIYSVIPTDLATAEDTSAMMINMLLPFLLLTFLFSGCMAVATESIAGEKERGTIATLLITPTKRSHIALGKVISLSITALASATVSFISVILSLPKLMGGSEELSFKLGYGFNEYIAIFAIIIITVLLFTVVLSLVSAFAKSVKEAAAYAMPVMVLIMVIGISSMLGTVAEGFTPYLIPVYNSVRCMSAVFAFELNPLCLLITVASNALFIALGIFALAKLFSSEKVMFNK